uniref:Uncharacterized protein n=1 Tax=Acrobeloides nanus TaxID=290746 RepID=A0A914CWR4_9BILA
MPSNYTEYYARHKLIPLCYNLESKNTQADPNNFSNYLNQCFYNHTFIKYVDVLCDLFTPPNPNITCVSAIFASHDDQAIIMMFRGTTTNPELVEEEGPFCHL